MSRKEPVLQNFYHTVKNLGSKKVWQICVIKKWKNFW